MPLLSPQLSSHWLSLITDVDAKADLGIALKVLVQDMYDNRTLYVDTNAVNKTVDAILGQYRQNFVPAGDDETTTETSA